MPSVSGRSRRATTMSKHKRRQRPLPGLYDYPADWCPLTIQEYMVLLNCLLKASVDANSGRPLDHEGMRLLFQAGLAKIKTGEVAAPTPREQEVMRVKAWLARNRHWDITAEQVPPWSTWQGVLQGKLKMVLKGGELA